jgi:hypothetical protein
VSRGAFCPSCCRAAALTSVLVIGFDSLVLAAGEEPRRSRSATLGTSREHPDFAAMPDIRAIVAPVNPLPAPQLLPDVRVTAPAAQLPLDRLFRSNGPVHNGPQFELGSEWSLFAGVTNNDARMPGAPRHWTGAGLGYRPNESWNVDFGFVHPYTSDTRFIDPLTASNPFVSGRSGGSQLFGLSGRYRFDFGGH